MLKAGRIVRESNKEYVYLGKFVLTSYLDLIAFVEKADFFNYWFFKEERFLKMYFKENCSKVALVDVALNNSNIIYQTNALVETRKSKDITGYLLKMKMLKAEEMSHILDYEHFKEYVDKYMPVNIYWNQVYSAIVSFCECNPKYKASELYKIYPECLDEEIFQDSFDYLLAQKQEEKDKYCYSSNIYDTKKYFKSEARNIKDEFIRYLKAATHYYNN